MPGLSEFELIETLLTPLAAGAPGAFALTDDAAVLPDLAAGDVHVVTKDAVVVGTHMLPGDPPGDMARKALRVNLSDLAAMGARPVGVFMALCLGQDTDEAFVRAFIDGLADDIDIFSAPLMGGDIVRHAGPMVVTMTAIGSAPKDKILMRSGAHPGDSLWVSGTIGDSALGLLAAQGHLKELSEDDAESLIHRYCVPQPRLALGQALGGLAHACIDVSDGLIADVMHLCDASGVGCTIEAAQVPVSDAVRTALNKNKSLLETVITGGDDYELAFAIPADQASALRTVAESMNLAISRLGQFSEGQGVRILDQAGNMMAIAQTGYRHI